MIKKYQTIIFSTILLYPALSVQASNYAKDYCDGREFYPGTNYPHLHCDKNWITFSQAGSSHSNFLVGDTFYSGKADNACTHATPVIKAKINEICTDFSQQCTQCQTPPENTNETPQEGDIVHIENALNGLRFRHSSTLIWNHEIHESSTQQEKDDSSFYLRAGLANKDCYSFESKNFPSHFIRHQGYRVKISPYEETSLFLKDSTFCPDDDYSLFPINYPDFRMEANTRGEVWISSETFKPNSSDLKRSHLNIVKQPNCYGIAGTFSEGTPLLQNGSLSMTSSNDFEFEWNDGRPDAYGQINSSCQGYIVFPHEESYAEINFNPNTKTLELIGQEGVQLWHQRHLQEIKPVSLAGQNNSYLGQGVYWPSGSLAASRATIDSSLNKKNKPITTSLVDHSRVVQDESGYNTLMSNITSVSGNGYGQSASASVKFTSSQKVNRTSLFYYVGKGASIHSDYIDNVDINNIILEDLALDYLIEQGARAFIERYGSHWITSMDLGGTFNASHNVESESQSSKQTLSVEASASVSAWGVTTDATNEFNSDMEKFGQHTNQISDTRMTGATVTKTDDLFETANLWFAELKNTEAESLATQSMKVFPFASLTQVFGVMNGKRYEWLDGGWNEGAPIDVPEDISLLTPDISSTVVDALYNELSSLEYLYANITRARETGNYLRNWQGNSLQTLGERVQSALEKVRGIRYLNINGLSIDEFNSQYLHSPELEREFENLTQMNQLVIKWKINVGKQGILPFGEHYGAITLTEENRDVRIFAAGGSPGGLVAYIKFNGDGVQSRLDHEHHNNKRSDIINFNDIKQTPVTDEQPPSIPYTTYIENFDSQLWVWAE